MHDKKERRIINQIFRGKCLNDVQINGWVAYLKKVKSIYFQSNAKGH